MGNTVESKESSSEAVKIFVERVNAAFKHYNKTIGKLRQYELAEKIHSSPTSISPWFTGRNLKKLPQAESILLLASALQVRPEYLMGFSPAMTEQDLIEQTEHLEDMRLETDMAIRMLLNKFGILREYNELDYTGNPVGKYYVKDTKGNMIPISHDEYVDVCADVFSYIGMKRARLLLQHGANYRPIRIGGYIPKDN